MTPVDKILAMPHWRNETSKILLQFVSLRHYIYDAGLLSKCQLPFNEDQCFLFQNLPTYFLDTLIQNLFF